MLVLLLIFLQVFITCFCNYFNIDAKVTREDWLNFFRGLRDFFGGAYRRYVKRANENAQKQRRLDEIENFRNEWYLTFAWLLLQAIIATRPCLENKSCTKQQVCVNYPYGNETI